MAQQADVSSKSSLTVTGSTSVSTYSARGIDDKGNAEYHLIKDSTSPASDVVLTASGRVRNGKVRGFVAEYRVRAPIMKAIASSGDVDGYTAVAAVADYTTITVRIDRSDLMADASILEVVEQVVYMLSNDSTLKGLYKDRNRLS